MLATAFATSARALHDIGLAAGMSPVVAVSIPVVVDGTAVLVARVLGRLGTQTVLTYGWSVLLLMATVSVVANGLHASPVAVVDLELSECQARALGALPPLALVLGFHLYLIVKRTDTSTHEKAVLAAERAAQPRATRRRRTNLEDKAREAWENAGGDLSGAAMARLLNVSL